MVYNNTTTKVVATYYTDTYSFCFFKEPNDPTKLWPIGTPSAMLRIIASRIAYTFHQ